MCWYFWGHDSAGNLLDRNYEFGIALSREEDSRIKSGVKNWTGAPLIKETGSSFFIVFISLCKHKVKIKPALTMLG